jgi:hypothetical protein
MPVPFAKGNRDEPIRLCLSIGIEVAFGWPIVALFQAKVAARAFIHPFSSGYKTLRNLRNAAWQQAFNQRERQPLPHERLDPAASIICQWPPNHSISLLMRTEMRVITQLGAAF